MSRWSTPASQPATASNAFNFVVRNPTGQLTGWIEHMPMVNITCDYGAVVHKNTGVDDARKLIDQTKLVDPTKHATKDISRYEFRFHFLGSSSRINTTDYEGGECTGAGGPFVSSLIILGLEVEVPKPSPTFRPPGQ